MFRNSTLTHTLKNRYIVRSRHDKIGEMYFSPPNPSEARLDIKPECIHVPDIYKNLSYQNSNFKRSPFKDLSENLRATSPFKSTSPIPHDSL